MRRRYLDNMTFQVLADGWFMWRVDAHNFRRMAKRPTADSSEETSEVVVG